jgi:Spy/CpxP family protein refolding chaperone
MVRMGLMAVAMFAGVVTTARAQEPQQQGGRRPNMMAMALTGITLSADQQTKIDAIAKKYQEQRQAIMAEAGTDRDAARAKSRELQMKQIDEVKALLTDDQKKVFDKNVEEARAKMQQNRPPSTPPVQ